MHHTSNMKFLFVLYNLMISFKAKAYLDEGHSLSMRNPRPEAETPVAALHKFKDSLASAGDTSPTTHQHLSDNDEPIFLRKEFGGHHTLNPRVEEDPCHVIPPPPVFVKHYGATCNAAACGAHPLVQCARRGPRYRRCVGVGMNYLQTRRLCHGCQCRLKPAFQGMGPGVPGNENHPNNQDERPRHRRKKNQKPAIFPTGGSGAPPEG